MLSSTAVLSAILANPTDIDNVRSLVTEDVEYVSLNYDNPDLKRIMPWAGTSRGAQSIVQTFEDVGRFWNVQSFERDALFGSGDFAALFGKFTYESTVLKKSVTSPFAVFAKVANGRCSYLQFMEDTFATGASFKKEGSWTFVSDPLGEECVI
jgi:ketosteroid isomerase-like protein